MLGNYVLLSMKREALGMKLGGKEIRGFSISNEKKLL